MKGQLQRAFVSCCFAFYSFILFFSAIGVHEAAHDVVEGKPLPAIANLIQIFKPAYGLWLLYPLLVGFCYWRYSRGLKLSAPQLLAHLLLIGFAIVVCTATIVGTSVFTYMNGTHPITGMQILGTALIGAGLVFAIWKSYR